VNVHFYDRVARLEREHASFAIATVVARQSPVSSHLGDRALVFPDGHMEGFVGGSCSRDIVRRQALGAIRTRRPVLLQIRNGTVASAPGCDHDHDDGPAAGAPPRDAEPGAPTERVVIPMSCSSEGAVDVYIEPRVPLRRLVIVGFTPVADALARLASALDYNVVRVVADDELRDVGDAQEIRTIPIGGLHDFVAALGEHEREALVAVVASQGHYDELALEELHGFDIAFTGLLASRRRAATVLGVLARSPGEVAISILAEIIANGPVTVTGEPAGEAAGAVAVEIDPICGMEVETANARYRFTSGGRTFFFCCAGCRASFAADPERYLAARGSA
jgi:xanthine dehydrogenase accessory factor